MYPTANSVSQQSSQGLVVKGHRCEVCDISFSTKDARFAHWRDSPEHHVICYFCHYTSSKREVDIHFNIAHPAGYRCELCMNTFPNANTLKEHNYNLHMQSLFTSANPKLEREVEKRERERDRERASLPIGVKNVKLALITVPTAIGIGSKRQNTKYPVTSAHINPRNDSVRFILKLLIRIDIDVTNVRKTSQLMMIFIDTGEPRQNIT